MLFTWLDFSECLESDPESLIAIAKQSSERALKEAASSGLPIIYLFEGKIVKEFVSGEIDILELV